MPVPEPERRRATWSQYRTWPDDQRIEIVGGVVYDMTPAPLVRHQMVSGNLEEALRAFFKGKPCRMLHAPVDVRLSEEDVVQPDILVVCDESKFRPTHVEGPPDLVVEILSPSTTSHDRVRKFNLYASAGVKEYWLVTTYPPLIEVFTLTHDGYRLHGGYEDRHTLRSAAFDGLEIELAGVFDFPIDPDERIQVVREARPDEIAALAGDAK